MEQEPTHKFTIPLAIVAAGALIAGAIYFGGTPKQDTGNKIQETNDNVEISPVTEEDHYLGSRDADVVIVEYSDTECPFCKVFHNTMKQVMSEYGNKVGWVYRHFPIPQLHKRAMKEAEATECAAELGGNQAFWNYLDKIFEITNSNDSLDPAELPKIAGAIGLNTSAFNICLESGKHTATIRESMDEAVKAGARGTPYSLILDKDGNIKGTINGAEPLESIKAKIDALI